MKSLLIKKDETKCKLDLDDDEEVTVWYKKGTQRLTLTLKGSSQIKYMEMTEDTEIGG